jgi:hypothetical protein
MPELCQLDTVVIKVVFCVRKPINKPIRILSDDEKCLFFGAEYFPFKTPVLTGNGLSV